MMNRINLATALTAVLLLAPACSESAAASAAGTYILNAEETTKPMIEMIKAAAGGKEPSAEQLKAVKESMKGQLDLNADLTYSGTINESTTKGTWSIKEGTVTLVQTHLNDEEKAETVTATAKDGVLSCTMEQKGKPMTIVFDKKK